jgi:hypothetical protein
MGSRRLSTLVPKTLDGLRDVVSRKLVELDEALGPFYRGNGTPEGAVAAPVGSLYLRMDGGATTTLYVKESGTGNTGWVAK